MRKVTAGQFRDIGDGVYTLRDDESIRVDVKEPSRAVGAVLSRHDLVCTNLGSFYYQLRKRAGLVGTRQRERRPAAKRTAWHRALNQMSELLALITSNMHQGRMELVEGNLGAIHEVVARLLEAGHEWLQQFGPLVEERARLERGIGVLARELGDRGQLAREFTPAQIEQLVSMNVISERDAQVATELRDLEFKLDELNRSLGNNTLDTQARASLADRPEE